jgi:hypothetical protein
VKFPAPPSIVRIFRAKVKRRKREKLHEEAETGNIGNKKARFTWGERALQFNVCESYYLVLKKVDTKTINLAQEEWQCQQKNDG